MEKKVYYALTEGDILGRVFERGEPVGELTEREAKYLVMQGTIGLTGPTENVDRELRAAERAVKEPPKRSEPDPATLDRKTR